MSESNTNTETFDVFLCHNGEDKPEIRDIAHQLAENGIKPWLDEEQIIGGRVWQEEIEKQIVHTKAAAIFVGKSGIGPWQSQEIRTLLDQFVNGKLPVIPVILNSAKGAPEIPLLLKNLHWIDFRVANPDPLEQLIRAITVEKPDDPSITSSLIDSYMPKREDLLPSNENEEGRLADLGISDAKRYPAIVSPPKGEQRDQLLILLNRVKEFWIDGVLKQSLYNEVLISLGKRAMDEAVEPPWKHFVELQDERRHLILQDRSINNTFDATGLLLILGEPGSGKTTTLLELASALIGRARLEPKERVPIVLNLSSWKKNQTLDIWIVEELSAKYRIPRRIGKDWLYNDHLLPLLDGLDEVDTPLQSACALAINEFIGKFEFIDKIGPSGLVVCCRLMEYQWLSEPLKLNGAICLKLLGIDEVNKFLTSGGPQLTGLQQAMDVDPILKELSETPLMLSIMSLAYEGVDGEDLAKQEAGTYEERREQIFKLYVERMFQRKGFVNSPYSKDEVIGWLRRLARGMKEHSQSVFMVEGLQPSWLNTKGKQVAYGTIVALIIAFIFGLAFGLIGGLGLGLIAGLLILIGIVLGCWSKVALRRCFMSALILGIGIGLSVGLGAGQSFGLSYGLGYGLISGLIGWLIGWLIGGVVVGTLKVISPVETLHWQSKQFWRKAIQGFIIGLSLGSIIGLGILLSMGLSDGLDTGLWLGITFGLTFGLTFGAVKGLLGVMTDTVRVDKSLPNEGINLSLKNAVFSALIFCPIFLLIFLLIYGLAEMLQYGLLEGWRIDLLIDKLIKGMSRELDEILILGLLFSLIGGLNRGGSTVVKHYSLRFILWIKGYTPFNFIKFLDHCAKLILLKKVGGGYIFIHRMLLEHFAKMELKSAETKKSK